MKKLLATMAIAITLLSATTPVQASQFKSYYALAANWRPAQQVSFANSMIGVYERSNRMYSNFINKYSRYAGASWYDNMKARHAFQVNEIAKYKLLIEQSSAPKVTLVDTVVTTDDRTLVNRKATVVTSNTSTVEVETTETMVSEYAVVTQILTTPVHTIYYTVTNTTKVYSDGTRQSSNAVKVNRQETVDETETKITRELVRQYAVVIKQEPTLSDPIATVDILTVDEYLARADVDYSGTQAYIDAVHSVNSRINSAYITEDRGLAKFGNSLAAINAPEAWARGWTGKGSTIAILDTGIDTDHTEFTDSIADMKCFTRACSTGYETIEDKNRYAHGTHVAGIAAGNLDGNGSTGVAYDAELLIAKTAHDFGMFDFSVADDAIEWAVERGADAINISANYNVDRTYKYSMKEIAPGMFRSNDKRGRDGITYDNYGYSNIYNDPSYYADIVEAMTGHEAVLVLAAGNQRLDFAGQPASLALDDEIGNRVLVVGNYDIKFNKMASSSNKAGTVCYDFNETTQQCNNTKRVSDRFILAPGQWIMSADNNGEYRTNSGTSMAAPIVSGAVGIVHQMWPHMTGANIAKLLLDTASTDEIIDYDVNVHGQGLLDLNEATTPQGVLGIPTTGRIDGKSTSVDRTGTIAISGASISALQEVMVVDDYDRDFYFDANASIAVNDTRTASATQSAQSGFTPDYYIGYTGGKIVPISNGAISINSENNEFALVQQFGGFTVGLASEQDSFLGNVANSDLMRVTGATTAYVGYGFDTGLLFGNAQLGATDLDVDNTSFLKSASTLMSYSATVGTKKTIGNSTFGFVTSLPVSISSGQANFNMPSSVSADGAILNSDASSSLATQYQEVDFGVFYNNQITDSVAFDSFAELRTNYAGTTNDAVQVGFNFKVAF